MVQGRQSAWCQGKESMVQSRERTGHGARGASVGGGNGREGERGDGWWVDLRLLHLLSLDLETSLFSFTQTEGERQEEL